MNVVSPEAHLTDLKSGQPLVTQSTSAPSRPQRYDALDFVKGFLVVGMVVFHAISYFSIRSEGILQYLKFVSGGFIFLSGYILHPVYEAKWRNAPASTTWRLVQRGLKLIVLFTVLNAAINALAVKNFNGVQFGLSHFIENLGQIYLHGTGRQSAFEILLPIGYLLIASPLLLAMSRSRPIAWFLMAMCLLTAAMLSFHLNNWTMMLVGISGMLLGQIVPPQHISKRRHLMFGLPVLALAMIGLYVLQKALVGYIVYIVIVLKCAADLYEALPARGARQMIVFWGRNVLFCYLFHIVVLQAIFRLVWPNRNSEWFVTAGFIFLTYLSLALVVWGIAWARRRFEFVNTAYKVVFQ